MLTHCDLLIRGGRVFDGLGSSKLADVAISSGHVVAVAPDMDISATSVVEADGLWVTPGFVDIHTHYDLEVEVAPALTESVRHGVTTVVMGGCSLSTHFAEPADLAYIFSRVETLPESLVGGWLQQARAWSTPSHYFQHLRALPLGPNVASMLGHSALRTKVMGLERSLSDRATAAELAQMKALAEQALEAGCIGISIDMVHWHKVGGPFAGRALPSHHASYEEYAMLADVCRARDAVFQATPNPSDARSFLNLLRLCPGVFRAPLRSTILSALDMDSLPHLWRFYPLVLFVCNGLLGCNIRLQTLTEPFTVYSDGHLTPFFEEFSAGVRLNNCKTRDERRSLWQSAEFRKEFERTWSSFPRTFHRDFSRMIVVSAPVGEYAGKSVAQIARENGKRPLDFFMTLLELYDEDLRWVACSANIRDNVRQQLMKNPGILPGFSDAGAHGRNLAYFDSALSLLRQAVGSSFMPVEKAVSRVTGEPARWFNVNAGQLKAGVKADLVLLDPEKLKQPIPEPVVVADAVLQGAPRMVKRDSDPAVRRVYIRGTEVVRDGAPVTVPEGAKLGDVLTQLNPTRSQSEALDRHRNQIAAGIAVDSAEYWPVFLLKHQHPGNVALHVAGFVLMYVIPILAITKDIWLILLLPLSQALGLLGHWLFERSPIDQRDAVFSLRAFLSLHRMFLSVLCGRYRSEVARVRRQFNVSTSV